MSRLRRATGNHYNFWCPGCQEMHTFGPQWQFNGNMELPTFEPSLSIKSGHYAKAEGPCWCTWKDEQGNPAPFKCYHCHLKLKNGKLEFLPDCTHSLAGQTVDLPEVPFDA